MDRRSFLSGLAGIIGTLAFDPERLLWVPGAKTFFLPPTVESNYLVTIEVITKYALAVLRNNLYLPGMLEVSESNHERLKIGDIVTFRRI